MEINYFLRPRHIPIVRRCVEVKPIPNADKIVSLVFEGYGYPVVGMKSDGWVVGGLGYLIPPDTILPLWLLDRLNLVGKLHGPELNRVGVQEFRGSPSHGLVIHEKHFESYFGSYLTNIGKMPVDLDIAQAFMSDVGLVHYFPLAQDVVNSPGWIMLSDVPGSVFDVDDVLTDTDLHGKLSSCSEVAIMEKLEGSNGSIRWNEDGELRVCTRNSTLVPPEGDFELDEAPTLYRVVSGMGLLDMVREATDDIGKPVEVFGELLGPGVEGNIYKLAQHQFRVFEIRVGGLRIDPKQLEEFMVYYDGQLNGWVAPILACGIPCPPKEDLAELAHGVSVLSDKTFREGIVISGFTPAGQYVVGKVRDIAYLSGKKPV